MRSTPMVYFQALNRATLIFGVERRLFFMLLAIASSLVLSSLFRPMMLVIGSLLFCLLLAAGRLLTKNDQTFLKVYQRHLRYRSYYDPVSFLKSPINSLCQSVPNTRSRFR